MASTIIMMLIATYAITFKEDIDEGNMIKMLLLMAVLVVVSIVVNLI